MAEYILKTLPGSYDADDPPWGEILWEVFSGVAMGTQLACKFRRVGQDIPQWTRRL